MFLPPCKPWHFLPLTQGQSIREGETIIKKRQLVNQHCENSYKWSACIPEKQHRWNLAFRHAFLLFATVFINSSLTSKVHGRLFLGPRTGTHKGGKLLPAYGNTECWEFRMTITCIHLNLGGPYGLKELLGF